MIDHGRPDQKRNGFCRLGEEQGLPLPRRFFCAVVLQLPRHSCASGPRVKRRKAIPIPMNVNRDEAATQHPVIPAEAGNREHGNGWQPQAQLGDSRKCRDVAELH